MVMTMTTLMTLYLKKISPFLIGNTSSFRVHFPASYVRLPECKPTTRESQHLPPTKPLTAGLAPQTTRRSVINGGFTASFTAALFLNTSSRSPSACLGGHKDPKNVTKNRDTSPKYPIQWWDWVSEESHRETPVSRREKNFRSAKMQICTHMSHFVDLTFSEGAFWIYHTMGLVSINIYIL